jgi:AraC family transcriptional regulator of adaptative response / DNA-3-methyladenine glycosylase II
VLGQQVTVGAGVKLVTRLCERFGAKVESAPEGLSHAFASSARVAAQSVEAIAALGMPRKRAETIQALARAHADGKLLLARGAIAAGREGLARIPGIGPWTIEYVALRALGDPDAYPGGDAALAATLGAKGERFEDLRPWRAYAAMRLWRSAAQAKQTKETKAKGRKP